MRTLLLLRGAPGSGKSTFVKENNLEPYTLEADRFRTLVCNPILDDHGDMTISQRYDHLAWKMLYDALELRMERGDFTVIDATHSNPNMFRKYKKLMAKYRYRCYYMEFDPGYETILQYNANRPEYKRVPEQAIERIYAMFETTSPQSFATKITSLSEIENYYIADDNTFDNVMVIGDIHGCYTAFSQLMNGEPNPNTKYVFCGDYLDRGLENAEIFAWLMKHHTDSNIIFLEGNHEIHMINYSNDTWPLDKEGNERKPHMFMNETLPQLLASYDNDEESLKKDMRAFCRRLRACYAFMKDDKKYLVTHAGLSSVPKLVYISTKEMIQGVGSYETEIDQIYTENYPERTQGFIQIHGHRFTAETNKSICLESRVEFGGNLSALLIATNKEPVKIEIKNTVYRETAMDKAVMGNSGISKPWLEPTGNTMTDMIAQNPYVRVKRQTDENGDPVHNLASLNFSNKAFDKKIWDGLTNKARGLFVDTKTGDIKLRSYNKFFNMYERAETSAKMLQENCVFPLKAYQKENGFLGIMSVVNGETILATKSTISGNFVDYFREIWDTCSETERKRLHDLSVEFNCSFVFEVCHIEDRHIIDFDTNHLILLDAIPNKYDIGGIDINEDFSDYVIDHMSFDSGVMSKKVLLEEFDSIQELEDFAKAHRHDRTLEGVVCQDRNGYMFKYKFHYYTTMKKLRGSFDFARSQMKHDGIPYNRFSDARTIYFIKYFENKGLDAWENLHIIDAIKEYEANKHLLMALD